MRIGILTVSDRAARGEYEDKSGSLIADILSQRTEWNISHRTVVGDDIDSIIAVLREWCDDGVDLILTNGGTGFAPRDVTPEATLQVVDRLAPGIVEALRYE